MDPDATNVGHIYVPDAAHPVLAGMSSRIRPRQAHVAGAGLEPSRKE
jgi:hypothetical protein